MAWQKFLFVVIYLTKLRQVYRKKLKCLYLKIQSKKLGKNCETE